MKPVVIFLLSIFLLSSCSNKTTRVLLFTGGHLFERDEFFSMLESLPDITFEEVQHPNALAKLKPENRKSYDVILLYDMPNAISETEKADFINYLEEGNGLVVLHHSYCSYQDWPEYKAIIGGKYYERKWVDENGVERPSSTFKHNVTFTVNVADKKHPITKGIEDFEITDETYKNSIINPGVHVLLTTTEPTSSPVIAWTNKYGKSEIPTILLGHDDKVWTNPNFKQLLRQAIIWAK